MKKIAFVVTRYGREVNGGSEVHCRMLAERLTPWYEVHVFTTTCKADEPSETDYEEGISVENNVTIHRFHSLPGSRSAVCRSFKESKLSRRIRYHLYKLKILPFVTALHPRWHLGINAEEQYFRTRSQYSPTLIEYLTKHEAEYAAIISICYAFPLTVFSARIAPQKCILIPTAHPEKLLFHAMYTRLFTEVRHIAFNSRGEQHLCQKVFGRNLAPNSIVGVGIEQAAPENWNTVKTKYKLPEQYVLYLGRIVPPKIQHLLTDFKCYRESVDPNAQLVIVGSANGSMATPDFAGITYTGFVTDAEKTAIVQHAHVMINPSKVESLSLLALEAMYNGIPLLVNGKCAVLKDHCIQSQAALWFDDSADFMQKLHRLCSDHELRTLMQKNGPQYIARNYDWNVILHKLQSMIEAI